MSVQLLDHAAVQVRNVGAGRHLQILLVHHIRSLGVEIAHQWVVGHLCLEGCPPLCKPVVQALHRQHRHSHASTVCEQIHQARASAAWVWTDCVGVSRFGHLQHLSHVGNHAGPGAPGLGWSACRLRCLSGSLSPSRRAAMTSHGLTWELPCRRNRRTNRRNTPNRAWRFLSPHAMRSNPRWKRSPGHRCHTGSVVAARSSSSSNIARGSLRWLYRQAYSFRYPCSHLAETA